MQDRFTRVHRLGLSHVLGKRLRLCKKSDRSKAYCNLFRGPFDKFKHVFKLDNRIN